MLVESGLGGNLSYYKTDLVDIEKLQRISGESKIKITYQAGEMIAIRENTLNESDKNDWWQIFENEDKKTAIYFKEDKVKLPELVKPLEKENKPTVLYRYRYLLYTKCSSSLWSFIHTYRNFWFFYLSSLGSVKC